MKLKCDCGELLEVKESMVGKQVECPHCGLSIYVAPVSESDASTARLVRVRCSCGRRVKYLEAEQDKRMQCPFCRRTLVIYGSAPVRIPEERLRDGRIRFWCACGKRLKTEPGSDRVICPACSTEYQSPTADREITFRCLCGMKMTAPRLSGGERVFCESCGCALRVPVAPKPPGEDIADGFVWKRKRWS